MSTSHHEKDAERVARGLKASIHNPRVSPEAKAHAEERLHEMGADVEPRQSTKTIGGGRRRSGRRTRQSGAGAEEPSDEPIPGAAGELPGLEAEAEAEEGKGVPSEIEGIYPTIGHKEVEARVLRKTYEEKDPMRVAAGYKATLHNPGISDETKDQAEEHLKEMGAEYTRQDTRDKTGLGQHQGGDRYGGTSMQNEEDNPFNDPNIPGRSRGAKGGQPGENREIGGYKATLHNPRVSEAAKEHAREVLKEHGVEVDE
ncbi:hypothetical protein AX17_001637 [Amanita inopinata Kibby_2008]|nr:hypothetical protein AX17_001637 [Amanita inopinata Kibby_2008]